MAPDVARSPEEARAHLKKNRYDIVLLDLDLGFGTDEAIGVLAWMRKNQKCYPTIIVSLHAGSACAIRAERNYKDFVRLRLSHDQLIELAHLIDTETQRIAASQQPSLMNRSIAAGISVFLILIVGYSALHMLQIFPDASEQDARVVLLVVLLAGVSGLIHILGLSAVRGAARLLSSVVTWFQGTKPSDGEDHNED